MQMQVCPTLQHDNKCASTCSLHVVVRGRGSARTLECSTARLVHHRRTYVCCAVSRGCRDVRERDTCHLAPSVYCIPHTIRTLVAC